MLFQIRLVPGGSWHRRTPNDQRHTACGQRIPGAFLSRDSSLDGDLCPACFTVDEIDTGRVMRVGRDVLASLDYEDDTGFDGVTPTDVIVDESDD